MRKRNLVLTAACATVLVQGTVMAAITVDGSYDGDYSGALALQTNNTQFGNSTSGDGTSGGGSELDGIYSVVSGGNLNILITGNLELNFNHLNLFIADGRPGQNTINANGALAPMTGSKFSSGFNATYALDMNGTFNPGNSTTTMFVNQYNMPNGGTAQSAFIGQFSLNDHTAHALTHGSATLNFSMDNTNAAGVDGTAPSLADQTAAGAVKTGLEIAIPLSELGSPTGSISIMADINGGGNGFLSNQFLPGLQGAQGNVGNGGKFDFSGVPNMFVQVGVPSTGAINGTWALSGSGSWSSSSSWTGGVPKSPGDTANFGTSALAAATVTLDGSKSVARMTFNNSVAGYTITQGTGGTLTIDDTTSASPNPAINVQAGNHTIAAPVAMANGVTVDTLPATSLTVSGNVSGSGGILKTGEGKLVLSGSNSFAGGITSQEGVLELDSVNAAAGGTLALGDPDVDNQAATLQFGTAVTNYNGAITTNRDLAANNNLRTIATAGNATIGSTVTVNGGVALAPAAGTTLTFTGTLQNGPDQTSGRHGLRVSGAGTVVLNGTDNLAISGDPNDPNNGDSNLTAVDSGTLVLSSNVALPSNLINVFTAGTFVDNGLLPSTAKVYAQGRVIFRGNTSTTGSLPLGLGTLTIDNGGSVTISHSTTSAQPVAVDVGALEFIGSPTNGQLDLTNNTLRTTNDQNMVRQQLQFANIVTSTAGGTLAYQDTGDGHTQILFDLAGDADFNHQVTTADFTILSQNFNQSGLFWAQGDFNYDGTVNALDFNALATNFGKTLPAPVLGSLVPEPTSLAMIGVAVLGLRRRRR